MMPQQSADSALHAKNIDAVLNTCDRGSASIIMARALTCLLRDRLPSVFPRPHVVRACRFDRIIFIPFPCATLLLCSVYCARPVCAWPPHKSKATPHHDFTFVACQLECTCRSLSLSFSACKCNAMASRRRRIPMAMQVGSPRWEKKARDDDTRTNEGQVTFFVFFLPFLSTLLHETRQE
jgi:hypothetical protein